MGRLLSSLRGNHAKPAALFDGQMNHVSLSVDCPILQDYKNTQETEHGDRQECQGWQ